MESRFADCANSDFDLIIIGGGIIGCGAARDAALRGLRVALFEKEDFGYGTSSRSTRLIHGGLRYLEMLDFGLVRQDLREREILLRIAPHRVRPLPFLVPFYHQSFFYRAKLRLGMALYDLLSYDKSLPKHRILSREETLRCEPGLSPEGLQGAALYYDAQANLPELLCVDNVLDAAAHGAQIYNHAEVIDLLREGNGRVTGIRARDTRTGETSEARAGAILNISGPWLNAFLGRFTPAARPLLRLTKGIHFTAPSASQNALVLFSRQDGRLFFVIPWLGYAWVGTTDTDFDSDLDAVHATQEDVYYLLDSVRPILPNADWNTIYYSNAGVRALVRNRRPNARESEVSRKHGIIAHTAEEKLEGMVSVLGGKLTAYRDIAREAVEAAVRQIPAHPSLAACETGRRPLPGGEESNLEKVREQAVAEAANFGLTAEQAGHLVFLYGTRYAALLRRIEQNSRLGERLSELYPDVRAQVVHAVETEFARTAGDFLMRRSMLTFTADQGKAALPNVVEIMGELLGWNADRKATETEDYLATIAQTQRFRSHSETS